MDFRLVFRMCVISRRCDAALTIAGKLGSSLVHSAMKSSKSSFSVAIDYTFA
jgi:hypothetical protein